MPGQCNLDQGYDTYKTATTAVSCQSPTRYLGDKVQLLGDGSISPSGPFSSIKFLLTQSSMLEGNMQSRSIKGDSLLPP